MTVLEFLTKEKPEKYIITDRTRVPLSSDVVDYLELAEIEVYQTEVKNDIVYIYTTFSPDSC